MTGKFLVAAGVWLLADTVCSIMLYLNAVSYDGKKQSWARDHSIRIVRGVIAVSLVVLGFVN